MDEYIGKGALYDALWDAKEEKKVKSLKDVFDFIDKFPCEDVAEVKHNEWIVDRDCTSVTYRCPICKFELTLADPDEKLEYKGCPMCLSILKDGANNDR